MSERPLRAALRGADPEHGLTPGAAPGTLGLEMAHRAAGGEEARGVFFLRYRQITLPVNGP